MLRDVYAALADVIRSNVAAELTDFDVEVEPRLVLQPSDFPCVDIYQGAPARDSDSAAFGDVSGFEVVTVRCRVSVNDDEAAQDLLVDFNDDQHDLCMAEIIESDPDLDGWATGVWVDADSFSGILDFSTASTAMVGCTWRVLVARAES